jgi:hypothetical protein
VGRKDIFAPYADQHVYRAGTVAQDVRLTGVRLPLPPHKERDGGDHDDHTDNDSEDERGS